MALDIVQLNIERFRRLLKETTDAGKRNMLEKLLAEEEAKRQAQRSHLLGLERPVHHLPLHHCPPAEDRRVANG
jgi:hypothetical protein